MHANRMFHASTFLAALDYLPTDPRFPNPALLHAMCAIGSLFVASVPTSQVFPDAVETPCECRSVPSVLLGPAFAFAFAFSFAFGLAPG